MAANLTTTYASQILDLLGLSKFKGGGAMPPCPPPPPDKNIPAGERRGLTGTDSATYACPRGGTSRSAHEPAWQAVRFAEASVRFPEASAD